MSEIYTEGLFDKNNRKVEKEFYDTAESIVNSIEKATEKLPQTGLLNKNKIMKDYPVYKRSLNKAKEKINKFRKSNTPTISIKINMFNVDMLSNELMRTISPIFSNFGFKLSKDPDSLFKKLFVGQTFYREEKDGSYTTLDYGISYTTSYSIENKGTSVIEIKMKNMILTDDKKAKMGIAESCGMFDEATFI